MAPTTFTGRSRQRVTRRSVRIADRVARVLIGVGGVGTIVAVSLVCVFLVWVVFPLFVPPKISPPAIRALQGSPLVPRLFTVDEFGVLGVAIDQAGRLTVIGLDYQERGEGLAAVSTTENRAIWQTQIAWPGSAPGEAGNLPTAQSWSPKTNTLALGYANGQIRLGRLGFSTTFVEPADLDVSLRNLEAGRRARWKDGVIERTPQGQFRWQQVTVDLGEPLKTASGAPIDKLDLSGSPDSIRMATLSADGQVRLVSVRSIENRRTRKTTQRLQERTVAPHGAAEPPTNVLLSPLGDVLYLAWSDGRLLRYEFSTNPEGAIAEELDLVAEPGESLTALAVLPGRSTLVTGDTLGRTRCWFLTKPPGAKTADGATLVQAHELPSPSQSAVTAITPSPASRVVAVAYADGSVRVFYATSERTLATSDTTNGVPAATLAVSPSERLLVGLVPSGFVTWDLDIPHPEASFRSLLRPLWYEGYERPAHVWQSTSGTDDFEPKLGLLPLIFGTLKATFYSLLFGVPIALCAAVYTSEFLHPRWRAAIKPTIELMASLPSVVLGFMAAIVLAPWVGGLVPATLAAFVTVPVTFLLAGYFWQMMPDFVRLRFTRGRFTLILLVLPLGILAAAWCGPYIEKLLFAGDLRAWLYGQAGSGTGGWRFALLPLSGVVIAYFMAWRVNPWLRRRSSSWSRRAWALADLVKFVVGALAAVLLAWLVAFTINALGFDPRSSTPDGGGGLGLVGTYEERNALIVGFVMGFAIIPLIYTISEDALSTVPEHLRSASLGAGATQWQTATWIIIPTAMSGLFSAVMIGLGRAVGETMIVLMAAGNTPLIDINIFNGFRTLSANLAVELPEADSGSTHFRVLFLTGLVLFAMTFVLNTAAEVVRQRFRRRAFQL